MHDENVTNIEQIGAFGIDTLFMKVSPQLPITMMLGLWQQPNDVIVLLWFMTVMGNDVALNSPGWIKARHAWIAEDVGIGERAVRKSIGSMLQVDLLERIGPRETSYRIHPRLVVKGEAVKIRRMFEGKDPMLFITTPRTGTRKTISVMVARCRAKLAKRLRMGDPEETPRPGRGAHLRAGSPVRARIEDQQRAAV